MKIIISTYAVFLILITYSCHDDIKFSLIGCCDSPIIFDSLGNALVYLPNVFTPNGDGVNDKFYVMGDGIHRVINFEIRDKLDKVVYQVQDKIYAGFEYAWDGKVNGEVEKGLYSVFLTLETTDGTKGSFEGKICNHACGLDGTVDKVSMENCHFANEWKCWEYYDACGFHDDYNCFE